jgi:hypothetical protein
MGIGRASLPFEAVSHSSHPGVLSCAVAKKRHRGKDALAWRCIPSYDWLQALGCGLVLREGEI